ncbi:thioesterase domain-containing protein [Aquabacterium sp. A7-Y]|nr:thioesterase domain-containing protein [Aquabacterium sp. A7-Y]MCW7539731.1 thioesterase domain-containing protein [Aquabacterium sp. A7-Y]
MARLVAAGEHAVIDLATLRLLPVAPGEAQAPGWPAWAALLARLFVLGHPVDWTAFDAAWPRQRLSLPGYPFQRRRCWYDPRRSTAAALARSDAPDLKGELAALPPPQRADWLRPYLADRLAGICGEAASQLRPDAPLAESGLLSSLSAVELEHRVWTELGLRLTPADLQAGATLETLAQRLAAGSVAGDPGADASPLVSLRRGTRDGAWFWVHPIGGSLYGYQALVAALDEGRPVYGLQAQGLQAGQEAQDDIAAMAVAYLPPLLSVQAQGPYRLGGWSLGAFVAWELAARLRARGAAVEALVLVDPLQLLDAATDDAALLKLLACEAGIGDEGLLLDLQEAGDTARAMACFLRAARGTPTLPAGWGLEPLRRLLALYRRHAAALRAYRPLAYDGPVLMLRPQGGRPVPDTRPYDWREVRASGTIEVTQVPGDHFSLLRKEQLQCWPEALWQRLGVPARGVMVLDPVE